MRTGLDSLTGLASRDSASQSYKTIDPESSASNQWFSMFTERLLYDNAPEHEPSFTSSSKDHPVPSRDDCKNPVLERVMPCSIEGYREAQKSRRPPSPTMVDQACNSYSALGTESRQSVDHTVHGPPPYLDDEFHPDARLENRLYPRRLDRHLPESTMPQQSNAAHRLQRSQRYAHHTALGTGGYVADFQPVDNTSADFGRATENVSSTCDLWQRELEQPSYQQQQHDVSDTPYHDRDSPYDHATYADHRGHYRPSHEQAFISNPRESRSQAAAGASALDAFDLELLKEAWPDPLTTKHPLSQRRDFDSNMDVVGEDFTKSRNASHIQMPRYNFIGASTPFREHNHHGLLSMEPELVLHRPLLKPKTDHFNPFKKPALLW